MSDPGDFVSTVVTDGVSGLRDRASVVKSTLSALVLLVSVPVALVLLLEGVGVLVPPSAPAWVSTVVYLVVVAVAVYALFTGVFRFQTWRRRR